MVQCVDCGLLAHIKETFNGQYYASEFEEVGTSIRIGGTALPLVCIASEAGLIGEITNAQVGISQNAAALHASVKEKVLDKERGDCPSYFRWRAGDSPKEHRQMLDAERMRQWQAAQEKAAREWQADESRLNREHQKRLTDASDAIQSDMAKATARAARFQFWGLAIAAFGIVVAAIVSQI